MGMKSPDLSLPSAAPSAPKVTFNPIVEAEEKPEVAPPAGAAVSTALFSPMEVLQIAAPAKASEVVEVHTKMIEMPETGVETDPVKAEAPPAEVIPPAVTEAPPVVPTVAPMLAPPILTTEPTLPIAVTPPVQPEAPVATEENLISLDGMAEMIASHPSALGG